MKNKWASFLSSFIRVFCDYKPTTTPWAFHRTNCHVLKYLVPSLLVINYVRIVLFQHEYFITMPSWSGSIKAMYMYFVLITEDTNQLTKARETTWTMIPRIGNSEGAKKAFQYAKLFLSTFVKLFLWEKRNFGKYLPLMNWQSNH